jgi:hypothetical protein
MKPVGQQSWRAVLQFGHKNCTLLLSCAISAMAFKCRAVIDLRNGSFINISLLEHWNQVELFKTPTITFIMSPFCIFVSTSSSSPRASSTSWQHQQSSWKGGGAAHHRQGFIFVMASITSCILAYVPGQVHLGTNLGYQSLDLIIKAFLKPHLGHHHLQLQDGSFLGCRPNCLSSWTLPTSRSSSPVGASGGGKGVYRSWLP